MEEKQRNFMSQQNNKVLVEEEYHERADWAWLTEK